MGRQSSGASQQQGEPMSGAVTNASAKSRELISFVIGDQQFCVDVMAVREIRGWSEATPLPHAPDYVQGMINLRGTVLPIIDMRVRLGIAADEVPSRRVIIVAWIGSRLVGLIVDSVRDILTTSEGMVQPTPEVAGDAPKSFISGVLTIEDRMVCLISLDHLLPELNVVAA
jgi:purine-binding chemotaxis protein CheW